MKKATRILTTILVLSIAAVLYCFIVAPLLEPESKYQKGAPPNFGLDMSTQQIMSLFNSGDWESSEFVRLKINNIHLFAGNYEFPTPESVKINRLTAVIVTSEKPLKAIIIRCSGAATLHFEKPIARIQNENNRILRGVLVGKINIFSKGDEENFSFETDDFYIDKDRIGTKANVKFRYGRTYGIGSGMQIQLINHGLLGSQDRAIDSSPLSSKIEKITIQKLQRLTIVPPVKKQENVQREEPGIMNSPIELHCDGPFEFNALNKYASFKQNVSLIQSVSNKASNSIRCQLLNIYFSSSKRSNSDVPAKESTSNSDSQTLLDDWNLQPQRLEAVGSSVVIEIPEYQTKINTSRLIANLSPLSFELDSENRQSEIHYKNHMISAQNMIYRVGDKGTLGTLECNCPGWISSQMDQDGKQIRARWTDMLRLEPDCNDPFESIVSIQGSARLEIENQKNTESAIYADDIFFWLTHNGNPKDSNGISNFTLSRMQAKNNVVMKSKPITAKVKTIQLWFEQLGDKEQGTGNSASPEATRPNAELSSNNAMNNSEFQIPNSESDHSYSITGDLLQGKILLGQGQFKISEMALKDGIRIIQNNDSPNNEGGANSKLELTGSQIQLFNLTEPSATAALFGQPAKIRYNNMTLTGTVINVNRGINRIWIDSGGEAVFIGNQQGEGNSDSPSENSTNLQASLKSPLLPAKITWSKNMVFQNDTLTFTGGASLQRKDQYAQCDALSIVFNKKIDFQNLNSAELRNSLDVHYIILNNSVKLENVTVENGATVAMDCLTTSKLTIDMKKQIFVAEGPGRAMTQRKMKGNDGEADASQSANDASASQNPLSQLAPRSSQLINLSVDFQKRLEGAFAPHSLSTFTFSGYVEAVYSPIDEIGKPIKTFNLSELPPEAFTLKCSQMEIQAELDKAELGKKQEIAGSSDSPSANLTNTNSSFIASGGVTVEGRVYNASADKITFEAKNGMMTLEGDGQIPAQFFYQKVLGGRYNQASSSIIYYNTQTGAVQGEGIQEFSLFLTPKNSQ